MIQMVKHIVDTRQFKDRRFLEGLFDRSDDMMRAKNERGIIPAHDGKVVGGFFYQPSTRTRTSFETAALRIGARTVFTENAKEFSSAIKGETLEHSLLATQEFYDAVVVRHHESGAAARASKVMSIPYINAGDGNNQHPTQALLDLYTIDQKFGRIDGLKVAFVGDMVYGRTIRSLAYLLAQLDENELYFVAPKELGMPTDMTNYLKKKGAKFSEHENVDEVMPHVDVLYDTRLQLENIQDADLKKYLMETYKNIQITAERADKMREGSIIMHPLPINREKSNGYPEIKEDVDSHPRAHYFRQSNNGLYVRMALLDIMLSGERSPLYSMILDVP